MYNAAIIACGKGCEGTEALGLMDETVKERLEVDTITYNAAISARETGQWTKAIGLLGQMVWSDVELAILSRTTQRSALVRKGGE